MRILEAVASAERKWGAYNKEGAFGSLKAAVEKGDDPAEVLAELQRIVTAHVAAQDLEQAEKRTMEADARREATRHDPPRLPANVRPEDAARVSPVPSAPAWSEPVAAPPLVERADTGWRIVILHQPKATREFMESAGWRALPLNVWDKKVPKAQVTETVLWARSRGSAKPPEVKDTTPPEVA